MDRVSDARQLVRSYARAWTEDDQDTLEKVYAIFAQRPVLDASQLVFGKPCGNILCTVVRTGDKALRCALLKMQDPALVARLVSEPDSFGWRPRHWAAFRGDVKTYRLLKSLGALGGATEAAGGYPSLKLKYLKSLGRWPVRSARPAVTWMRRTRHGPTFETGSVKEMLAGFKLGKESLFTHASKLRLGDEEFAQEMYASILATRLPPAMGTGGNRADALIAKILQLKEKRGAFSDADGLVAFGLSTHRDDGRKRSVKPELGVFARKYIRPGELICRYAGTLTWNLRPSHEMGSRFRCAVRDGFFIDGFPTGNYASRIGHSFPNAAYLLVPPCHGEDWAVFVVAIESILEGEEITVYRKPALGSTVCEELRPQALKKFRRGQLKGSGKELTTGLRLGALQTEAEVYAALKWEYILAETSEDAIG